MSNSPVSTPQVLGSTTSASPLRSTPMITEPQITLPSSVSSRPSISSVSATGSTTSTSLTGSSMKGGNTPFLGGDTPKTGSNRTVGDILRKSPRSSSAPRQTPVGTLTRTSVAGNPSVRMTKSAPKKSTPSLRSRTPVLTPAPVEEKTPVGVLSGVPADESTEVPSMTVPSSVVQTPSSTPEVGGVVTPQQAAVLSPGLKLPTILPSRTPSTRTPSSRTPSTRTPSTRTPSTRTPSTRTPSSRTPSTRTPSTRTPSPQRQGLPLPSVSPSPVRPLSPTALSPSSDLTLPVVVPSAVRTPVSSPVRSPVRSPTRSGGLTLPTVRSSTARTGLNLPTVRSAPSTSRTGLTLPTVRASTQTLSLPTPSRTSPSRASGGLPLPSTRSPTGGLSLPSVRSPVSAPVRSPVNAPVRSPLSRTSRQSGLSLPLKTTTARTGLTLPLTRPSLSVNRSATRSKPSVTMVKKSEENSKVDDLINHGFLIEHRLYHEGVLSHLLVRTIHGDLAFLKVDGHLEVPSSFSGTDLTMDKKTTITLVPHETKLSVLQCLDNDLCGAAFVCDDHVCITEKGLESGEVKFKEETFSLRGNGQLVGGRIGRSLVAHPVVPLSQALYHPVEIQIMISNASKEIAEKAFLKLNKFQESLDQAVERLDQKVHALKDLTQMVHDSIDNDLLTLEEAQEVLLSSDDSDEIRALLTQVSDSLHKKKLLRTKIINALAASHGMTGMIESLTNEIEQLSTPVLEEFVSTQGQA